MVNIWNILISNMWNMHKRHMRCSQFPDMFVLQVFWSVNGFSVILRQPAPALLHSSICRRDLRAAPYVTQPEPELNKLSDVSDEGRVLQQQ